MGYNWRDGREEGMHELAAFKPDDRIERLEERMRDVYLEDQRFLHRWEYIVATVIIVVVALLVGLLTG